MDRLVQSFEGLIRRSLAPSVTFFVMVALGDLIRFGLTKQTGMVRLQEYLWMFSPLSIPSAAAVTSLVILVLIGFSYGLQTVQQVFFDNWLKENFDPTFAFSSSVASEARVLTELRGKVTQRLRTEPALSELGTLTEVSDYVLYEILGGIDPTPTYSFVDSAKAMGIVFVSLILVLLGNALIFHQELGLWTVLLVVLAIIFYVWGREVTLTQYRARALRLYVNFLAMPTRRIHRRLLEPEAVAAPASDSKKKGP